MISRWDTVVQASRTCILAVNLKRAPVLIQMTNMRTCLRQTDALVLRVVRMIKDGVNQRTPKASRDSGRMYKRRSNKARVVHARSLPSRCGMSLTSSLISKMDPNHNKA